MQNHFNLEHRVGLLRRFGVMIYDSVLLSAVLFFASLIVVLPFGITTEHYLYPAFIAYVYLVSFVFFGWFWTHGVQTLGLKTWHIRLISENGNAVNWKQALIRYIASLVCWLSLGVGFLWCYTNQDRLAWNDILSKTRLQRITPAKSPDES